jgi:hypothetical protein
MSQLSGLTSSLKFLSSHPDQRFAPFQRFGFVFLVISHFTVAG